MIEKMKSLFPMFNDPALSVKIYWSLGAVMITFITVWILHILLTKFIENKKQQQENCTEDTLAGNLMITLSIWIKSILIFCGIFVVVIIILEIFNFKIVTALDFKMIGINILKVAGIVIGAKLTTKFGCAAIVQAFSRKGIKDGLIEKRRAHTLEELLISVVTYTVFFLAGLMILQVFNVNTSAILASAGILGLAVGFGAKNLVTDIISGFFIIFEDQFSVGDYVEAGGVIGFVEGIGLRTVKIRKWSGPLHIIPNGEITKVTNYHRGLMQAQVVLGIAYEEDIDGAISVLEQESKAVYHDLPAIKEMPEVHGVVALDDFAVKIRIVAKTTPGDHWAVERELLKRYKNALERANIEIPYPKSIVYKVDSKEEFSLTETENSSNN